MSFQGTYAELVRMFQDAQCIITGRGPGETVTGRSVRKCKLRKATGPIDPTALIVAPGGPDVGFRSIGLPVIQNFLYCNSSPVSGSQCTTGNNGAQAVDVMDYEAYATNPPIEILTSYYASIQATLQPAELANVCSTEGGYGDAVNQKGLPGPYDNNPDLQVSFMGRYFPLLWFEGVSHAIWYGYDASEPAPCFHQALSCL